MSDIQEELNRTVAKLIAEASDNAYKSGFYMGQAMAGAELEECHEAWKKLIPTKGKDK